jgi:hypothetical protein
VRYVLEMNKGWFAKRGIKPGTKLTGAAVPADEGPQGARIEKKPRTAKGPRLRGDRGPCFALGAKRINRSSSREVPVHQLVEEGLDELRTQVAVVDVVRVLPHVHGQQRLVGVVSGVPAAPVLTMSTLPSGFFTSQVQPEPKLPTADLTKASLKAA